MTKPVADQASRDRALIPEQSFIVQAPAGSGKTELLIQRFLKLLTTVEKYPEEVLALTFTRKAANEMRQRLLHALIEAKQQSPCEGHQQLTRRLANTVLEKDQQHQWHLLDNAHRLSVMTIDGLCASLSKRLPLLSNLGGQPAVTETPTKLYEQAAFNTLTTAYDVPEQQSAIEMLLHHCDNRIEMMTRLLSQLLAKREQWLPLLLTNGDKSHLREKLESALIDSILADLKQAFDALQDIDNVDDFCRQIQKAALFLNQSTPQHPIAACASMSHCPDALWENIDLWRGIAAICLKADGEIRKTVNANLGFPAPSSAKDKESKAYYKERKDRFTEYLSVCQEHPTLASALNKIALLPQPYFEAHHWQLIDALITLLPLCAAQLILLFQQSSEVDFVQITQSAIEALGHELAPSEIALALDNNIKHILVDEFQDTSLAHCQLLQALIREWQEDDGRSLFVVGDPMQSIYRFREARVDLFIQAKQFGLGNIKLTPLTLSVNFRSKPEVVDWNNQLYSQVFPMDDDPNYSAISYSPSEAFSEPDNSCGIQTHFLDKESSDESSEIIKIIQQHQQTTPESSIAILVRSRGHLQDTLQRLRQHDIPAITTDIEVLTSQSSIEDCLALTFALDHLADSLSWFSLLRAPWCGLRLTDCYQIKHHQDTATVFENLCDYDNIKNLTDEAKARLAWFVPIMKTAVRNLEFKKLNEIVYQTWITLGGAATVDSEYALTVCETYFDLLNQYCRSMRYFDRHEFKKRCHQTYLPTHIPNIGAQKPVEVMTIHKSKGLEFDVVILPGLARISRAAETSLMLWTERFDENNHEQRLLAPIKSVRESEDKLYQYISNINREKDKNELARLLYVACTRAKKHCHLIASLAKDSPPARSSLLSLLWPYLPCTQKVVKLQQCSSMTSRERELNPLTRHSLAWIQAQNDKFGIDGHVNPQKYQPREFQLNLASMTGTYIHQLLQVILKNRMSEQPIPIDKNTWFKHLYSLGIELQTVESQVEKTVQAVSQFLRSKLFNILRSDEVHMVYPEYPVSKVNDDGSIGHYRIDCYVVNYDGTHKIIDFKTSEPSQSQSIEAFLIQEREKYSKQLQTYAECLMEKMENVTVGLYFPMLDLLDEWAPVLTAPVTSR